MTMRESFSPRGVVVDLRDDAFARLLEAGRRLLRSVAVTDVLPGVRAVCREADLPTGSFYHAFPDAETFHLALVASLVERDAGLESAARLEAALHDAAAKVDRCNPDNHELIGLITRPAAESVDGADDRVVSSFRIRLLLSGLASSQERLGGGIATTCAELNDRRAAHEAAGYAALLDALGLRVREPFDVSSIAAILGAVTDGLLLRGVVDPDFDALTLIEDTIRAICYALLAPVTEDAHDFDTMCEKALERVAAELTAEPLFL